MKLEDLVSIDLLADFLSGTQAVAFEVASDKQSHYDRVWSSSIIWAEAKQTGLADKLPDDSELLFHGWAN